MANVSSKSAIGCALLFTTPFLLAGLGMMIFTAVIPMARLAKSATWIECEAEIVPASERLEANNNAEVGSAQQTQASYTYTAPDGSKRISRKVSFSNGYGNIDSQHSSTHQRLKKTNDGKIICYVNPNNMDDAALLREVDEYSIIHGSLFGFVFAFVGAFLSISVTRLQRKEKNTREDDTTVQSTATSSPNDVFIAAVPVCLNLWMLYVFATMVPDASSWTLLLLIPVITPILVVCRGYRNRRIFGEATFAPEGRIRVGGALSGAIRLANGSPDTDFEISAECTQSHTSGSGKSRTTSTKSLWSSDEINSRVTVGNDAVLLQFATKIPYGLPESNAQGRGSIKWILTVKTKDKKFAGSVSFHLYVHKAASDPVFEAENSAYGDFDPNDEKRIFAANAITVNRMPSGGVKIVFPSEKICDDKDIASAKASAFFSLLCPLIFAAIIFNILRRAAFAVTGTSITSQSNPTLLVCAMFLVIPFSIGISARRSKLRRIRKEFSTRVLIIERKNGATLRTELADDRRQIAAIPDIQNLKISNINSKSEKTQALYIHSRRDDVLLLTENLRMPEHAGLIGELLTKHISRLD